MPLSTHIQTIKPRSVAVNIRDSGSLVASSNLAGAVTNMWVGGVW